MLPSWLRLKYDNSFSQCAATNWGKKLLKVSFSPMQEMSIPRKHLLELRKT